MIKMDLSLLNDEAMDDSFLVIRSEAMDDEVTQIFKKWKLNNPVPKKDIENFNTVSASATGIISTEPQHFDSRTFTRPPRRRTFNINSPSDLNLATSKPSGTSSEIQLMESGIASININLQVGGAYTPMQRSWLKDVSPPSSICTSMDFPNNDTMLNSLVTSSDFTNVSFLLNGSVYENPKSNELPKHNVTANSTITLENGKSNNQTITLNNANQNLMDFTFDVLDKTLTNEQNALTDTFVTDSEPPMKEFGIENADIQLNTSTEDIGKNLTFNKYEHNMTWDKIQNQDLNATIVQSTPVHKVENLPNTSFDETLSPISSLHAQIIDDEDNDDGELILRSMKGKRLLHLMDDYRNSMEDQCEFLLNEETIKLSSRVCGDSFECLDDIKQALISSTDANEGDFDKILDSFNVKKSKDSEKLLQSVDSIKQRHSLINMEKQREEKHKKDSDNDNRNQYDVMNKSSERLLNRRSRLFDDVNLQLQKQQQQIETSNTNGSASASSSSSSSTQLNKSHNSETTALNDAESEGVVDKNDRDRFKTIKLNRPRLQTGVVVIDTEEQDAVNTEQNREISPGSNKERRNQLNQQKQEEENVEFKKPSAPASRLSKFGFSRPTYRPRNELNLPLKASSTDSLDNDSESSSISRQPASKSLKSPMGIKSKSIHNLMFNGAQNGLRMTSDLKYSTETKSHSNLKVPRASSLVRQNVDTNFKLPQSNQARTLTGNKKPIGNLVRPSSGYYGNAKRLDSDNESYSLSSSSASSRNSVHLSLAPEQQFYQTNSLQSSEDLHQTPNQPKQQKTFGAVPKPSGISRPTMMSGLPRPQGVKSGLPRPRR